MKNCMSKLRLKSGVGGFGVVPYERIQFSIALNLYVYCSLIK